MRTLNRGFLLGDATRLARRLTLASVVGVAACSSSPQRGTMAASAGPGSPETDKPTASAAVQSPEPERGTAAERGVEVQVQGARWSGCIRKGGRVGCWEQASPTAPVVAPPAESQVQWLEISNAASISYDASNRSGCAVLDDGQVACWDREDAVSPVPGLRNVRSVMWTGTVFCIVRTDGTGACGERPGAALVPVDGLVDALRVEAYLGQTACFLLRDGRVQCSQPRFPGAERYQHPGHPIGVLTEQPVEGAQMMAAGGSSAGCFIVDPGGVRCLTQMNRHGDEARNQTVYSVPLRESVELAVDHDGVCARDASGAVRCWERMEPELSPDDLKAIALPAPAVAISRSCALLEDDSLWCWGSHYVEEPSPIPGIDSAIAIAVGDDLACTAVQGGDVYCWGHTGGWASAVPQRLEGFPPALDVGIDRQRVCVRSASGVHCGQPGQPVQKVLGATDTMSADIGLCGIRSGVLECAGLGETPSSLGTAPWGRGTAVDIDGFKYCLVRQGGGVECSVASSDSSGAYRHYVREPIPGVWDAKTLALGPDRGCVLNGKGGVSCWGMVRQYERRGPRLEVSEPRTIPGPAMKQLACDNMCCGVTGRGEVRCWEPEAAPVAIGVDDAAEVAIGGVACIRHRSGTVSCWGPNEDGTVGDGGPWRPYRVEMPPTRR